ncbi:hypothetical protein C4573_03030 [Candidatus Woesearchaeota archaeon]|nr:MAG: hypothetical protein C4573_03030 [Candidatus Woesearchaeota archaeon]
MVVTERSKQVLDNVWSVILPKYEEGLSRTMFALNDCMRLGITQSEVLDALHEHSGLAFVEGRIYDILANIGENIYHVTRLSNIQGILENGLQPKVCDKSDIPDQPAIPTVFMAKSPSHGACICGYAREKLDQAVIELHAEQIDFFPVNSIGHRTGVYNVHEVAQLGSHVQIQPTAIKTVYFNANVYDETGSALERACIERGIPLIGLDVSLHPEVPFNKNTWTRVIAEYRSR